jgi:Amidases related to nicotinamidase
MSHPKILNIADTALLIVDVQEAFRSAVDDFSLIASRIATAARAFQILELPIIVTEQYPKGLGRTAEEIQLSLPANVEPIEKTMFSAGREAGVIQALKEKKQIVLCGLETHICLNQTAHDLLDQGFEVHLLTDCVSSRFESDKQAGLSKMFASGVIPSSVETALFEMMKDSKHPHFKEIQALVK